MNNFLEVVRTGWFEEKKGETNFFSSKIAKYGQKHKCEPWVDKAAVSPFKLIKCGLKKWQIRYNFWQKMPNMTQITNASSAFLRRLHKHSSWSNVD